MNWASFLFLWAAIFMADFFLAGGLVFLLNTYRDNKCFDNVETLLEAFLFVFETAQTIGYGGRVPVYECPDAVLLTLIHIFVTIWIATFFAGTFLAKFGMARTGSQGLRFSTQAIVTKRNGQLHLVVRVADHVESDMDYGAEVKAFLVTRGKETDEPGLLHLPLSYQLDGSGDTEAVPLLWPVTVSHVMNSSSPLHALGPEELAASGIEVGAGPGLQGRPRLPGDRVGGRRPRVLWGAHQLRHQLHRRQGDRLGPQVPARGRPPA
jgi:hypothetical protein